MGLASWALFFCSPLSRPCSPFNIYIYIVSFLLPRPKFFLVLLPSFELSLLVLNCFSPAHSLASLCIHLFLLLNCHCFSLLGRALWIYYTTPVFPIWCRDNESRKKKNVFSFDHFITCTIQLHIAIFSKFRNHWHKMCRSFLRRWHTM